MKQEILKIIESVRNLHPGVSYACKNGNCYKFYLFLKMLYPEAIPYYNSDHVITLIGEEYYDIDGIYDIDLDRFIPMHIEEAWIKDAPNWSFRKFTGAVDET